MIITHKFDMAVDRRGPAPVVDAVQGEDSTRVVQISLYTTPEPNKKEPWAIPDGVSAMVRFRKKDGTGGIYDILPDGTDAITLAGNVITAFLAPQMLTCPGTVLAQVELTTGTKSMATFTFHVDVQPDPSVGAMNSEDYVNLAGYVAKEVERILSEGGIVAGDTNSVKNYGAAGDGVTDDTAVFRAALANERVVSVPGGTYLLSGELVIGANCMLELSQDTVLNFTQTSGNAISMLRSANLKGNHATIFVPYTFGGNVINCDTGDDEAALAEGDQADANNVAVPPFTKWDPQWKMSRYVTDINICKPDDRGFHYSKDGDCYGTAVYLHCNEEDYVSFMWGVCMSGIRIAGGFNYGIRIYNIGETDYSWNHDMRIEAVIDACKIGVSVENCRYARLAVTIQPRRAYSDSEVYTAYAEKGIELIDSRGIDLSSSRVWDWNAKNTLWASGNEYQHLALYGECMGLILDDFLYYAQSSTDIRELIYTDTESNLEKMTILQEPITRWFKVKNNEPYFNDGTFEKKLATQAELDAHFDTDAAKNFTDVLATAIDTDGSIYNGIGYKMGVMANDDGSLVESGYYGTTGYIPCVKGSQIFAEDLSFAVGDDNCQIILFDANFNYVYHVNRANLITGNNYTVGYEETENGFKCTLNNVVNLDNTAYARFTIYKTAWGNNPMMSVDEEIKYTVEGFLADGVKVKGENIVGIPGQETPDWVAKKTESGGDVIVIAEQTITSGMWSKRQWDIVPKMTYEVYINGKRYTCKAYNYDGGIILGNYTISLASANVPHNNEPFYIYWAGGSATSGMFGKDSTLSYPITLKVTDNIVTVYNKMPEGYLPDGVAMLDDIPQGGGGVDVTAEVGQTIVVEEVDSAGKPAKWKAVDYQEKICGEEEVEILESTDLEFALNEGAGVYVASTPFDKTFEDGGVYKVTLAGVTYENTFNEEANGMGNIGPFIGGEDTGEPYIISTSDGMLIVISLVEISTATLSIKGNAVKPIDSKYLTELPYFDFVAAGVGALDTETATTHAPAGLSDFCKRAFARGTGKIRLQVIVGDIFNSSAAEEAKEIIATVNVTQLATHYRVFASFGKEIILIDCDGESNTWRRYVG